MDLAKFIDLLHQYPSWFRGAIVLWLLATALLAGGLLIFRPTTDHPITAKEVPAIAKEGLTEKPNVPVAAQILQPSSFSRQIAASPDEYARRLRALSDRFLEKQEFIDLHQNAVVEWTGSVDRVSQHVQSKSLSMFLVSREVRPEIQILVALPESLRTKAFSLQKNDVIRVKGKLTLSTPSMPDIEASELEVVQPHGS